MNRKLSALCLVAFAVFLLAAAPVTEPPRKGDHVDVMLSDGRVLTNAEVIKVDGDSILIFGGKTLITVRLTDINRYRFAAQQVAPAPIAEPVKQQVAPPPVPAQSISDSHPKDATAVVEKIPVQPPQPVKYMIWSLGLGIALVLALAGVAQQAIAKQKLKVKYSGIISLDSAMAERQRDLEAVKQRLLESKAQEQQIRTAIAELRKELALFDAEEGIVACGHYRPLFDFKTSDEFKTQIEYVREQQRTMIKNDQAARCGQKWTVNGSASEGSKATKRTLRLMLRAFNGESDAIIARVSWNNVDRMIERLEAVYSAINKLGDSYSCSLSPDYLGLKRSELRLAFEYEAKLKNEKDEQRELREQMRDEERARREMEEALKQSALDEERAKKALEQARLELQQASGAKEAALNEKIHALEGKLQEALANKERAISRAQLTRSGHVYIISNIGSFGETVYKIGMTRRLDPLDRVQELGDASVPFSFDIHAMIYTEDAPTLEAKLHRKFDHARVNLMNERKEFFNVSFDDLEAAVREAGSTIVLTRLAEAREYRETTERRKVLSVSLSK